MILVHCIITSSITIHKEHYLSCENKARSLYHSLNNNNVTSTFSTFTEVTSYRDIEVYDQVGKLLQVIYIIKILLEKRVQWRNGLDFRIAAGDSHRRECSESLSATENFCFIAGDVQLPIWVNIKR
jgi:hypothetical protein